MHRDLEPLARLQVERVVERLRVQQHAQAVGLAHLHALQHVPVVLAKDLVPVRHSVEAVVEGQLRLDDAADAVVCAEVGVEVGVVAEPLSHPVASL